MELQGDQLHYTPPLLERLIKADMLLQQLRHIADDNGDCTKRALVIQVMTSLDQLRAYDTEQRKAATHNTGGD